MEPALTEKPALYKSLVVVLELIQKALTLKASASTVAALNYKFTANQTTPKRTNLNVIKGKNYNEPL